MIVFSQPYEIAEIKILGTYPQEEICIGEVGRAVEIGVPIPTSFGCVHMQKIKSGSSYASS